MFGTVVIGLWLAVVVRAIVEGCLMRGPRDW